MFTGLIEEVGTVKNIKISSNGALLTIECSFVAEGVAVGDSIAINGACQTVTGFTSSSFSVDVSVETLNLTTFSCLKSGTKVNLERAMLAGSRLGGHLVSGHIEGKGQFLKKVNQGISDLYYFEAPSNIEKYMIYKGSICINGISLTVASIDGCQFSVAVIPLTTASTNLQYLKVGDYVNLEPDLIAKYIEKFVRKSDTADEKITLSYLSEHGFL